MADESKTEEPTEKRLREAREKGNTPFSQEASVFGTVLASLAVASFVLGPLAENATSTLKTLIADAGRLSLANTADAAGILEHVARAISGTLMATLTCFAVLGLCVFMLQGPLMIATERIAMKGSRLSVTQGLQRIFSKRNILQSFKAVAKFGLILFLLWFLARRQSASTIALMDVAPADIPQAIMKLITADLTYLAAISGAIYAADYAYTRYSWQANLRMTKQEVKEDHRSTEGDASIKGKRRFLARSRLRRRILAGVPKATLVVVNPTHYAVALRYVEGENAAPEMVSKGRDLIALRIKEIAKDLRIPIEENKVLARALHDRVDIGEHIPREFYKAIATIIVSLRRRSAPRHVPADLEEPQPEPSGT